MALVSVVGDLAYGAILNALVVAAAALLWARGRGRRRGRGRGPGEEHDSLPTAIASVLLLGLACVGLVVAIVTAVGSLGRLDSRGAVLAAAAIAAGACWIAGAARKRGLVRGRGPVAAVRSWRESTRGLGRLRPDGRSGWIALGAVMVTWLALLVDQAFVPPVAWDALTYHLMYPAHWLQAGDLSTLPQPFGDPSSPYYPLVGEMLYAWGLLSTGSDLWTTLAQLPAALLGALALAGITLRCGARPGAGALAALVWLSLPVLLRQTVEPMVDLWFGAFGLVALFFLLQWRRDGEGRSLIAAGAAGGLLVGTKYAGLMHLLPLLILWAGLAVARRREGLAAARTPGALVLTLALGVIVAVGLGGYAYLRNLWTGGNPVLPMEVSFGGTVILPGAIPQETYYAMGYIADELRHLTPARFLFSPRALLDFGPGFALLVAAPFLALGFSWRRATVRAVTLLALLLLAAHLLLIPYKVNRLLFAFTGAACALAVVALPARLHLLLALLPVVSAPLTLFYWAKELWWGGVREHHLVLLGLLVAGGGVVAWLGTREGARAGLRRLRAGRWRPAVAAGVVLLVLAGAQALYATHRYSQWNRFWGTRFEWDEQGQAREDLAATADAWSFVADLTQDHAATIATAGNNLPYPLTGHELRNRVWFVPRNAHLDGAAIGWGTPPRDVLADAAVDSWLANLVALEADYLVVFRQDETVDPATTFPVEAEWAAARPERFTEIHASPWARVYRIGDGVRGDPGAAPAPLLEGPASAESR